MPTRANSTFSVTAWDEQPWDEREGAPKMTKTAVEKSFQGDVEGNSHLEYLMAYRDDGSADFVGIERIDGTLGGRQGTFILRHVGVFIDGAASGTATVVEGSGTGDLAGISGESEFSLPKGEEAFPFDLVYSVPEVASR